MTQDHSSKLSFSIEESVWLNKGQEIQEILSMSLEPEISIEEKEEHVYIRGGLQLVGEYRTASKTNDLNLEEGSIKDQIAYRSIEEVSQSDDGIGEIKHVFPIDVTIPVNRIKNLEDVFVQVDSFDYDLPERGCIQLTADIVISGMSGAPQREDEVITPIPQETRESSAFAFEARKEPEQKPEPEKTPVSVVSPEGRNSEGAHSTENDADEENQITSSTPNVSFQQNENSNDIAKQDNQSFTSYFVNDRVPQTVEEENQPAMQPKAKEAPVAAQSEREPAFGVQPADVANEKEENEQQTETKINLAPIKRLAVHAEETVEEDNQEDESTDDRPTYTSHKQENALYLTKMLTNGEENFSKLKMCIIQENESLDTIAERYEVSTSQLLRVNRLNQEKVEEGQILYIPVSSSR